MNPPSSALANAKVNVPAPTGGAQSHYFSSAGLGRLCWVCDAPATTLRKHPGQFLHGSPFCEKCAQLDRFAKWPIAHAEPLEGRRDPRRKTNTMRAPLKYTPTDGSEDRCLSRLACFRPSALDALPESIRREVNQLPAEMDAIREAAIVRRWCFAAWMSISAPLPPCWPHWCLQRGGGIVPIWRDRLVRDLIAWLWWEERAENLRYHRPLPRWSPLANTSVANSHTEKL